MHIPCERRVFCRARIADKEDRPGPAESEQQDRLGRMCVDVYPFLQELVGRQVVGYIAVDFVSVRQSDGSYKPLGCHGKEPVPNSGCALRGRFLPISQPALNILSLLPCQALGNRSKCAHGRHHTSNHDIASWLFACLCVCACLRVSSSLMRCDATLSEASREPIRGIFFAVMGG